MIIVFCDSTAVLKSVKQWNASCSRRFPSADIALPKVQIHLADSELLAVFAPSDRITASAGFLHGRMQHPEKVQYLYLQQLNGITCAHAVPAVHMNNGSSWYPDLLIPGALPEMELVGDLSSPGLAALLQGFTPLLQTQQLLVCCLPANGTNPSSSLKEVLEMTEAQQQAAQLPGFALDETDRAELNELRTAARLTHSEARIAKTRLTELRVRTRAYSPRISELIPMETWQLQRSRRDSLLMQLFTRLENLET